MFVQRNPQWPSCLLLSDRVIDTRFIGSCSLTLESITYTNNTAAALCVAKCSISLCPLVVHDGEIRGVCAGEQYALYEIEIYEKNIKC